LKHDKVQNGTLIELLDWAFVQRILSDKSELSALAYTGSPHHPNAAFQRLIKKHTETDRHTHTPLRTWFVSINCPNFPKQLLIIVIRVQENTAPRTLSLFVPKKPAKWYFGIQLL
jgi:hypothetical protein